MLRTDAPAGLHNILLRPAKTTSVTPIRNATIAPRLPASSSHEHVSTTHPKPVVAPKARAMTSRYPSTLTKLSPPEPLESPP